MAQRKKSMIKEGKLDKHGKPNDKTPSDFLSSYKDYSKSNPPKLSGDGSGPVAAAASSPAKGEDVKMEDSNKRAKESDGNSSDEQPVKKKEKKEKKEKKKKE